MANSSADSAAADHRNKHLSINPPHQIFKDIQGSDSPIPLSPQWLLSKQGENKSGTGTVEAQGAQNPYGKNSTGNGEETPDNPKKKDVFRPSLLAAETGRREGWRDEERDTFSTVRNDRWRNGDKDFGGDNKKVDRWDNVGSRQFVEPRRWTDSGNKDAGTEQRRGPSDRWTDSGNKDAGTEQRRESKWNSRWGPDDKEAENPRNKWDEPGKDGEIVREKGPSLPSSDGDHYRPWRPSQGRGRGESLHSQSTPNKQGTAFSHSRGRGDNTAIFSAGRGRVGSGGSLFTSASNQSHPPGSASEKGESGPGEPFHVRYSRMKLLDVYRMADTVSFEKFPDGFIEVPSLTCEQPSDPLAICAPSSEEVTILDGIEKGKIVSSGAPQTSKDGPGGRNPAEFSQPRRIKPVGSREDMAHATDVSNESGETRNYPDDKLRPEASHEGYAPFRKANEVQGNNHVQSPWRQPGERSSRISHDWNDPSADNRLKSSDNVWSHPKDSINHSGSNVMSSPQPKGESRWQIGEDPALRRQPSLVFDREREVRKPMPSSPEELVLYYKDPQGIIQGPFSGTDIIGWLEAGYFGIDLLVRPASAPSDSPFSLLSDVMPHLRAKSGPPPGFTGAKPSPFIDAVGTPAFPGVGKVHGGMGETDMLQNDMRYKQVGGTVAENRFIESLMSGSLNNSSQGVQGYGVNSSGGLSLPVTDGGADMYLMAKKLELERQRSVASPYSYWPSLESANLMPGSENVPEVSQQPARSPSADLLSILQGAKDRSAPAVSGPIPAWSHSNQKDDLHHARNFQTQTSFGVQQQRQPEQNSPLAGFLGQPIENNPAGMLSPEMILVPGLSQEQQSLNLLQQQQLLLQLNAQPLSSQQQRLVLEKMLLLKQQQKREEQQLLLRQQQQLFSQVLADQQHPQQRFGEPSYGQLQQSFDALRLQESKDLTQVSQQMQLPVSHEDRGVNVTDFLSVNQPANQNVATLGTHPLHLQHHLFGNVDPRMSEGTVPADQIDDTHKKDSVSDYERTIPADYMSSLYSEKPVGPVSIPNNESATPETSDSKSLEKQTKDVYAGQGETINELNVETPPTEVKTIEVSGGRKTSEKKSKKQRGNKQSAEPVKAASKSSLQEANQTETVCADDSEVKGKNMKPADTLIDNDAHLIQNSSTAPSSNVLSGVNESSLQNTRTQPGRAWKPAPGFKPKSLLEIQMEEQRVAQAEALAPKVSTSMSSVGLASPWGGIVANSEPINLRETHGESVITQTGVVKPESVPTNKGKQSHLRDLLADDVVAKSVVKERDVVGSSPNDTYTQVSSTNAEYLDDDNFIDAKETKKSRKKSARAKNSGAKAAAPAPAVDTSLSASSVEKGKNSRIAQQQVKEDLPAIPSGPSLGDFVLWKEEPVNNPSPAAAWSTGPKKSTKPSSLRDIVREQEKMTTSSHPPPSPVPTTQKPTPPQAVPQSSWSRSSSQAVSQSSLQSKSKGDDDLFWGPVEQTTQESKQGDFPQLSSQNSWGTKTTPGKGSAGSSLNRQKSVSASSPASHKGKKEEVTKNTEANGFRDWCRSECLRLLGSEDTSVLEFCLKLSRSEAETLLIENLGSVDRDHKFIDKFLNYKDLLPSEVVEIAFQSKGSSLSSSSSSVGKSRNNNKAVEEEEYYKAPANEGSSKVGGKKKGKKGKKVSLSSSVLGFNVVSNRIMMGEIQSIED